MNRVYYILTIMGLLLFAVLARSQALPTSLYLQGYAGKLLPSLSVTVANGATTSSTINQGGLTLVGCIIPSAFTSTTITFKASSDNVTFYPVYNSSGAVSYTVAPSRYISFAPADLQGIHYLQIIAGTSEGGARTLICSLKGI